ncbi:hypothetical protein [Nonomuraea sp. LPB2021202275-12-8]|uniref:hypothetical protein n=1 Tax=Nonomuraea sp. LPB2021202275-12-8 TaxID=3120159 RepID=UPI00300D078E
MKPGKAFREGGSFEDLSDEPLDGFRPATVEVGAQAIEFGVVRRGLNTGGSGPAIVGDPRGIQIAEALLLAFLVPGLGAVESPARLPQRALVPGPATEDPPETGRRSRGERLPVGSRLGDPQAARVEPLAGVDGIELVEGQGTGSDGGEQDLIQVLDATGDPRALLLGFRLLSFLMRPLVLARFLLGELRYLACSPFDCFPLRLFPRFPLATTACHRDGPPFSPDWQV